MASRGPALAGPASVASGILLRSVASSSFGPEHTHLTPRFSERLLVSATAHHADGRDPVSQPNHLLATDCLLLSLVLFVTLVNSATHLVFCSLPCFGRSIFDARALFLNTSFCLAALIARDFPFPLFRLAFDPILIHVNSFLSVSTGERRGPAINTGPPSTDVVQLR